MIATTTLRKIIFKKVVDECSPAQPLVRRFGISDPILLVVHVVKKIRVKPAI